MAFAIALGAGLVLAFFLKGTADAPRRAGGFALLAALITAVAMDSGWAAFYTMRVYWLALGIVFVMGVVDDWITLPPLAKMGFQLAAALVFLFLTPASVWGEGIHRQLGWIAFPVLLIWMVGITNALNLLDNMDGLAAGVGAIAALGFGWLGMGADFILYPLGGALLGFLLVNFMRAPIYLGDSGSHLLGFSLAVLPLYGISPAMSGIPIIVLLIPIADTAFVSSVRLAMGISPFRGGKDHLSHRLEGLGVPKPAVALAFYAAAVGLTLLAKSFAP